jgi:hypothetical protein
MSDDENKCVPLTSGQATDGPPYGMDPARYARITGPMSDASYVIATSVQALADKLSSLGITLKAVEVDSFAPLLASVGECFWVQTAVGTVKVKDQRCKA